MKNKQSILFLTPKSSYYNSVEEVIKEGLSAHKELMQEDRELYTYLLYFKNSTYYSKSVMINNLLANSLFKPENKEFVDKDSQLVEIENGLILHSLFNENITHALKMLLKLKENKINNNRTTRLILNFLFRRGNLDFIAIKYKNKIKQLLVHALGLKTVNDILNQTTEGNKKYQKLIRVYNNPYDFEVLQFVFDKNKQVTSEYLKKYTEVRDSFKNNEVNLQGKSVIPVEVLGGFNNFYKRNVNIVSLISAGNVSEKQKIQLQNTVKKHSNDTMELKIDLNKYSIIELFKYMYNKKDITAEEVNEINTIIDRKATEIRETLDNDGVFNNLDETGIILDCSDSNNGSDQTKLHPLFKNMALARIFKSGKKDNLILVGGFKNDKGLIEPLGDTNLSQGLIDATKMGYKNVIVLSDGFENVNSFETVYTKIQSLGYNLNVLHFNPVFSPKNFSFKEIADGVTTIPFSNEKDVENLMLFYFLNTDKEKFKQIVRSKILQEVLA